MELDIFDLRAENLGVHCKKIVKTPAKKLTRFDYWTNFGFVKTKAHPKGVFSFGAMKTLEGRVLFQPGDYVLIGVKGERWPKSEKKMSDTMKAVSETDNNGWALYENTNTVYAYKMDVDFEVYLSNGTLLSGKAGSYLIDSGPSQWIVEEEIFNKTYAPIEK